ncbi:transglutaminase-like domain-containing protein [Microscilla marina]|uniref:Transglutaminase-like domain-containing protein n=1 Tax=Microscilla marina ATCC 23134 TaxID=313606 RepID=A1ZM68_MICM2|nr:transglutaminase domain-containing protein [Microscilla marina]EAY28600.1 hypothetical protein M23134_04447 [Microscilla marina ATCC 23134]
MYKLRIFTLIATLAPVLGHSLVFSQSKNVRLAQKYQLRYPNTKAVVLNADIIYEFGYNDKNALPYITETRQETYLALRGGEKLRRFSFYDQHSKIKETKRFGTNNEATLNQEVVCGNYNSDGIFYSDAQVCQYPFYLPAIGDIQGLLLKKTYDDPRYFTTVFFNDELPVIAQTVTFKVPQWMDVTLKPFNFMGFDIQHKKVVKENGNTHHIFSMRQLPAIENYDDVPGKTHTYPHVLVLSKGFKQHGKKIALLGSIDDLYQWYRKVARQTNNQTETLKPLVSKLISDKKTKTEQIKTIFYWVQDNIRYIAFEDGMAAFKPESAQEVYQKKYGDCKGMANLMKTMLKLAGFDARLTWIGTRRIAYDYTLPSIAVANHMICTLMFNNQKYYLDATEKYVPFGKYAERIQGRPVLIENGDTYLLEKIPVAVQGENKINFTQNLVIEGESLKGSGQQAYYGEQKKQLLYFLNHTPQKKPQELIRFIVDLDSKNCFADSIRFSHLQKRAGAFLINYKVKLDNMVARFDSELYIDLDFYKDFKTHKVAKKRFSSLDLQEKVLRKTKIILQLPKGYRVKHLPTPLIQTHPVFAFKIHFKTEGNQLIYTKEISTQSSLIKKTDFEAWNKAIDALNKIYNDQVILTKKQ